MITPITSVVSVSKDNFWAPSNKMCIVLFYDDECMYWCFYRFCRKHRLSLFTQKAISKYAQNNCVGFSYFGQTVDYV